MGGVVPLIVISPSSPVGSASPVSGLMIRISVPGSGLPCVSRRSSTGQSHGTSAASVSVSVSPNDAPPYGWSSGRSTNPPKESRNDAERRDVRRVLLQRLLELGDLVGVTWITVTLCRSSSRTASTGSKYSCITSLAPIPSVAPSTQIRPALQKSG